MEDSNYISSTNASICNVSMQLWHLKLQTATLSGVRREAGSGVSVKFQAPQGQAYGSHGLRAVRQVLSQPKWQYLAS